MGEWKARRLKDIADFNPKESLAKGTIAKKIAMDKLQPFCRDVADYETEAFAGGTKFRNGDTIMARITPCLENGKIAKVGILDEGEIGFGSTEYIVLRAKDGVDEDFIYYLTCSPSVRNPAIKSMVGSSGRQRVQINVVQNLELMIPPLDEQQKIARILSALDDKIEANNAINANLEQQAQTIYKKMFIHRDDSMRCGVLSDVADITMGQSPKGDSYKVIHIMKMVMGRCFFRDAENLVFVFRPADYSQHHRNAWHK